MDLKQFDAERAAARTTIRARYPAEMSTVDIANFYVEVKAAYQEICDRYGVTLRERRHGSVDYAEIAKAKGLGNLKPKP